MDTITITIEAEIGRDHRLVDALPAGVPIGRVRLVIEPMDDTPATTTATAHLTPDEARRRWQAAGKMLIRRLTPDGTVESNEAEDHRLADLFGMGITLDQLIDEDRGSRE